MSSNNHQIMELDIKDLLFVILKKCGFIVVSGLFIAILFFVYKYTSTVNTAYVLNTSERINGESDVDYLKRVRNVERAEDIFNSIDKLNDQLFFQREYVTDSLIMQIDARNEALTTAQFVLSIDENISAGIDKALVSSYSNSLMSGDYLDGIAAEFGTEEEYLKELISVAYLDNSSVIVNTEGSIGCTGTVTITVIGPSFDYTDRIMNCIVEEINVRYVELNNSIVKHSISMVGRQNSYMVDNHTRDLQYNAVNRFEVIQKQIDAYNDSLDKIASSLGLKNKENLYNNLNNLSDSNETSVSLNSAIKGAIIGFVIGVFIVLLLIVFNYVFGKKILTQTCFFDRFPGVRKIGVIKPSNRRSAFSEFIDRKSGDDTYLPNDINNKLLRANINNLTVGMNRVLITGTADNKHIKEIVAELNNRFVYKDSFFIDPSSLDLLSDYDGVILVEQRNFSLNRMVSEEIEYIKNADIELVGAIIV